MSDKPSPKSLSSNFMAAAVAVLVGAISLYLAIEVLRRIFVPIVVITVVIVTLTVVMTIKKRTGGSSDGW